MGRALDLGSLKGFARNLGRLAWGILRYSLPLEKGVSRLVRWAALLGLGVASSWGRFSDMIIAHPWQSGIVVLAFGTLCYAWEQQARVEAFQVVSLKEAQASAVFLPLLNFPGNIGPQTDVLKLQLTYTLVNSSDLEVGHRSPSRRLFARRSSESSFSRIEPKVIVRHEWIGAEDDRFAVSSFYEGVEVALHPKSTSICSIQEFLQFDHCREISGSGEVLLRAMLEMVGQDDIELGLPVAVEIDDVRP